MIRRPSRLAAGLVVVGLSTATSRAAAAQRVRAPDRIEGVDGQTTSTSEIESYIPDLMRRARVPAISLAVLRDATVVYAKTFGVKHATENTPADIETVFAGASFSKTVFAYIVMTIVDEGLLDLDRWEGDPQVALAAE